MKKSKLLFWSAIFALVAASCSGGTNPLPVATSTLALDPVPDPEPDPVPDPVGPYPTVIPTNSAKIPVTWASLNLTGKLVYSMGAVNENNNYVVQVQALDLMTGTISVLYKTLSDDYVYYVSVSPDSKQVVMSYSPPLQSNRNVVQALYIMPLDGSRPPELLFVPPTPGDQYIQAEWSPDGKYIYYTHVSYRIEDSNQVYPFYKIFRMEYPVGGGGQEESVAEGAYWPRLSADSSRLVYISVDPFSIQNKLIVADSDGLNAQEVVMSGSYIPDIKNAPIFTPDGKSIMFSGLAPVQSYQPNWFEKLAGIRIAKAAGEPSDWWSVPVSGGEITRLTDIRHRDLYASISPDNRYVASFNRDNIFVMKPDGSELTILISELHGFSSIGSWIP